MCHQFMKKLLEAHLSIRTVSYLETQIASPKRIAREGLNNIDTVRDQQFSNLVVPVILGGLIRYEDSFGEFELSEDCFRKLNFFFFQRGERARLIHRL